MVELQYNNFLFHFTIAHIVIINVENDCQEIVFNVNFIIEDIRRYNTLYYYYNCPNRPITYVHLIINGR